jgi:hypothetical protein
MTKRRETRHTPAGELSHGQAQIAFSSDGDSPARPAILVETEGESVTVRYFDNSTDTFSVFKADRLAAVFARADLCRFREQPFLLVNRHHGALAVATGPATVPSPLEVLLVSRVENGAAVEFLSDDESQPCWQLFAIAPEKVRTTSGK